MRTLIKEDLPYIYDIAWALCRSVKTKEEKTYKNKRRFAIFL